MDRPMSPTTIATGADEQAAEAMEALRTWADSVIATDDVKMILCVVRLFSRPSVRPAPWAQALCLGGANTASNLIFKGGLAKDRSVHSRPGL